MDVRSSSEQHQLGQSQANSLMSGLRPDDMAEVSMLLDDNLFSSGNRMFCKKKKRKIE